MSRFLTFQNLQQVIIGPLSHGGGFNIDPFADKHEPPVPTEDEQNRMLAEFFEKTLRSDQPEKIDPGIKYYTMGEKEWHMTNTWPPSGMGIRRYYLAANSTLSQSAPTAINSRDLYGVNFTASSGEQTRWHTSNGGGDVVYPDRKEEDKKLLVYDSAPLQTDIEITGSPLLVLELESTTSDGAIYGYLEDVSPEGRVTYLDEGILRVIHRKLADARSFPYTPIGPVHSLLRKDAQPLVPGELVEIQISYFATSLLMRKGHRVRLALAGADSGMFQRYPTEGTPTWTVFREKGNASYLELPAKIR